MARILLGLICGVILGLILRDALLEFEEEEGAE